MSMKSCCSAESLKHPELESPTAANLESRSIRAKPQKGEERRAEEASALCRNQRLRDESKQILPNFLIRLRFVVFVAVGVHRSFVRQQQQQQQRHLLNFFVLANFYRDSFF